MISGFRREITEKCALPGCYVFFTSWPPKIGPTGPETSVRNYQMTLKSAVLAKYLFFIHTVVFQVTAPCILAHSFLLSSIPFHAFSYIIHLFDCTNQIPTTQEHYQNRTRGLSTEFTPYIPQVLFEPCWTDTVTTLMFFWPCIIV